jgi:hypothetical protein
VYHAPQASRGQLLPRNPPARLVTNTNNMNGGAGPGQGGGNPSPPTSMVRSSIATLSGANGIMDERKYAMMENSLSAHHRALSRFLAPQLPQMRAANASAANNPAGGQKARDKLTKLSASQFQELSTDVFDELSRREDERMRGGPNSPGNPVPKYLLPKQGFHEKRNHARQKLSILPTQRFQFLAADVFFEQERRFPRFLRNGSRSENGGVSPSRNGPNGQFPPRSVSRQTDSPGEFRSGSREGYRPPASPFGGTGPSPSSANTDGQQGFGNPDMGKPLPKMYQSNVMVPNKGTMVEEDDEESSSRSMANGEREALEAEHRERVDKLERKLDELVEQLQAKDRELDDARNGANASAVSLFHFELVRSNNYSHSRLKSAHGKIRKDRWREKFKTPRR